MQYTMMIALAHQNNFRTSEWNGSRDFLSQMGLQKTSFLPCNYGWIIEHIPDSALLAVRLTYKSADKVSTLNHENNLLRFFAPDPSIPIKCLLLFS